MRFWVKRNTEISSHADISTFLETSSRGARGERFQSARIGAALKPASWICEQMRDGRTTNQYCGIAGLVSRAWYIVDGVHRGN